MDEIQGVSSSQSTQRQEARNLEREREAARAQEERRSEENAERDRAAERAEAEGSRSLGRA